MIVVQRLKVLLCSKCGGLFAVPIGHRNVLGREEPNHSCGGKFVEVHGLDARIETLVAK